MPTQYRSPEQLTVYTVITKNSLMCLMIYVLKQRAQRLPILGNLPILGDFPLHGTPQFAKLKVLLMAVSLYTIAQP
jgi:ABC-type amino acid transport system permease subunit